MPTRFDIRAVLYAPGGARQRIMSCESLGGTFPLDDASVLRANVSALTFQALPAIAEVALEVYADGDWFEPYDARFLVSADDDDAADVAKMHTVQGTQMIPWLLNKAIVEAPADPDDLLGNGTRPFNSATPGAIIKTLVDEAQALGWAPYVTYDFDADDDSAGVPWVNQLSIGYRPGTRALLVLKNLIDQGLVEFRTEGRMLRLFNTSTGDDYATAPADPSDPWAPVRVGRHATSTPIKRSIDDLITDATLFGDNGLVYSVENVGAPTELGRLVEPVQQGGVSDEGTAELLVQAQLERGSQVRQQNRATENAEVAEALPWVHYQVGDWVQGWIEADWQRVRVPEVVVQKQLDGTITVSALLNDRFLDALARLAKRTVGIVGGAVAGGSGAVPSAPGDDNRQPKAPTDLLLDSTGYWSNATPLSQVAASWAEVTQALDNVAIEVASYELWGRLDDGADESDVQTSTDTNAATWSPYAPGSVWLLKVRAISANGVAGPFSAEVSVTMEQPTLEVGVPTPPQLRSTNGIVELQWDGLIEGTPPTLPPRHFRQITIESSGEEAGEYAVIGTLFVGSQRANFAGLGVGSVPWFRFRSVDALGRESDPSEAVSITVTGIDGADLVANSIAANALQVGSITVEYLEGGVGGQLNIAANESITLVAGQIADVAADLGETSSDLADLRLYVVIDGDEMRLTRPGSDNAFALDNDRIAARQSGIDVSWWEAGQFYVPNMVATIAQIGPMQFAPDPDGTGLVVRRL